MADVLICANRQVTAARAAGRPCLREDQLAEINAWYRGAVAKGITDNQGPHTRREGRAAAGPPVPRPPGHDPAVHH
jgi:hypothetical protein